MVLKKVEAIIFLAIFRFKFPPKEKEIATEKETAKEKFEEQLESQESVINADYYTELKGNYEPRSINIYGY